MQLWPCPQSQYCLQMVSLSVSCRGRCLLELLLLDVEAADTSDATLSKEFARAMPILAGSAEIVRRREVEAAGEEEREEVVEVAGVDDLESGKKSEPSSRPLIDICSSSSRQAAGHGASSTSKTGCGAAAVSPAPG